MGDGYIRAHHDLIVIGSKPAGRRDAAQAGTLGKSVLVVELGRRIGGVSVHTRTILAELPAGWCSSRRVDASAASMGYGDVQQGQAERMAQEAQARHRFNQGAG